MYAHKCSVLWSAITLHIHKGIVYSGGKERRGGEATREVTMHTLPQYIVPNCSKFTIRQALPQ